MRILFDLCHPAHVHFFKHAIKQLDKEGHSILITARNKDCTLKLLDKLKLPYQVIYTKNKEKPSKIKELILRDNALIKAAKAFKAERITAIGGTFAAHAGFFLDVPSLVFYDGDNAWLQNMVTYPFASQIIVPTCYQGWTIPHKTLRYEGFHELAYCHPHYFTPNYEEALQQGLSKEKPTLLIRLVSWQASHDRGHHGIPLPVLSQWIETMVPHMQIIISSEKTLPDNLQRYAYQGDLNKIHHVMAFCKGFIGESPTMAIESALLGVPAAFISSIHCGNIQRMQERYSLVKHFDPKTVTLESLLNFLEHPQALWKQRLHRLLEETVDVSQMIREVLLHYPTPSSRFLCQKP